MAKSANSKVVFVPMQLQSDVSSQLVNHPVVQSESGNEVNLGATGRVGLLNAVSDV